MIMNLYAISLYLLISCLTSVNADFPTASNKSYFGVIKHFQSGSCFHAVDKKIVLSVIYHDCMLNLWLTVEINLEWRTAETPRNG